MKLIRKADGISNFAIYELNESEASLVEKKFKYKATFYVSSAEFCDRFLENHSFKDIIEERMNTSPFYYIGFFQTYLEAYYHIKLVEAVGMIDGMEYKMREALGVETYNQEERKMISEHSDSLKISFYPLTEDKPNIKDHLEFD